MSMTRRVLIVCGGRSFNPTGVDLHREGSWLRGIVDALGIQAIRHGAAPGADSLAGRMARRWNMPEEQYPADWSKGTRGGPQRNERMLDPSVLAVAAYPSKTAEEGKGGTLNMLTQAIGQGFPVILHPYFNTSVDLWESERQVLIHEPHGWVDPATKVRP